MEKVVPLGTVFNPLFGFFEGVPPDAVLKPINGQQGNTTSTQSKSDKSKTDVIVTTTAAQPNKGRMYDMSFLPDNMTEIPDLRESADKFNTVIVNYNELERFFQVADRKTKFENLYDVLCINAVNTSYTLLKT